MKVLSKILVLLLFSTIAKAQHNVILIIADDLGSDYCGFYENHLDTAAMPNIRKLLSKGVKFTRAWSNPLCSPTRTGILTGRYSFRTGVGNAVGGVGSAVLDTAEITIPKLLNKYNPSEIAKANIGKWHLNLPTPKTNYLIPNKIGYDHFEGNFTGVLNSYTNWSKITNGVESTITNYATTETADNAISWIKKQGDKPFFLWLAFNAPHTPLHLPPTNLHSYKNLSGTQTDIDANPKLYFKAMVEALDHEIGRVFDSLQVLNKWENTDIIFIGDNGDDAVVSQNKGGAKGSVYQEGVSVPFIISGPSVEKPNRNSDALVNTQDLFATILELFGYNSWQTQIPSNKPVDSKSLLPIVKNQSTKVRDWVFTEVFKNPTVSGDGKAMRNLDYKLIQFDNGNQEFYNLNVDATESNNLLKKTLTGVDLTNYQYLCSEMNTLLSKKDICKLNVGVFDEKIDEVLVFPNPFVQFIELKNTDSNIEVELSNAFGQKIYSGNQLKEQDFSSLTSGIYFLKVNKKYVFKLIKN